MPKSTRDILLEAKILQLPVQNDAPKRRMRVLLDRVSLEIWGNDGLVSLALGLIPDEADRSLRA
jgi:hypothetical protein